MQRIEAEKFFGASGAASRVVTGFAPRQPQIAYAQEVIDLIEADAPRLGLLDAETGTGKSLGYLVPLIHDLAITGEGRVVVATGTISLQKQIANHDVPAAIAVVEDALGRKLGVKVAMRVGRSQVLDPVKLADLIDELSGSERDRAERVLAWAEERIADGILPLRREAQEDLFAGQPRPVSLGDVVAFDGDIGSSRTDLWELYAQAASAAEEADILIVNHHLLALDLIGAGIFGDYDVPQSIRLVVDEADRLPDVLDQMSRSKVQFQHFAALASALAGREATVRIRELVDRLSDEPGLFTGADRFPGSAGEIIPLMRMTHEKRAELLVTVAELRKRASAIAQAKGDTALRREQAAELRVACEELAVFERRAQGAGGGVPVFYFSPVRRFTGVMIGNPLAKAKMSAFQNEQRYRLALMTSATLSSGADTPQAAFAPFLAGSGLRDLVEEDRMKVIESERFGEMTFVRPDPDAPNGLVGQDDDDTRLSPDTVAYAAQMVREAARQGGNALVLCSSHRSVALLAEALHGLDGLLVQRPGVSVSVAQAAALAQAEDGRQVVWLSASAWEGMSLPGFFGHIVIPRIPFRGRGVEDDLLTEYLTGLGKTEAFARSVTFGRMMADARRKLRQGIGRGIRLETDRVKVWIADSRFPLPQRVIDDEMRDQPRVWSGTFVKAIPTRFRVSLENAPSFRAQSI